MGSGDGYKSSRRFEKASTSSYFSTKERGAAGAAAVDSVFEQQTKQVIHDSMKPGGVSLRESRDSENHPTVTSIILAMDVTGSMGRLPVELVTDGLPKIMGKLIQAGVDPSLLFMAIGDHECDKFPMQIGQFETGDEELDLWLTRSYIEGNGGGNAGESYLLAWYVAAYLTATDDWDKRKKKGFLFTFGDEPTLINLPGTAVKELFGENKGEKSNYTAAELFAKASEQWEVFHIDIHHGGRNASRQWKSLIGQHLIEVDRMEDVSAKIVETVGQYIDTTGLQKPKEEMVADAAEVTTPPAKTDIPNML